MNIKKLFATLAGVSLFAQTVVPFGALAATYSAELQGAYDWAYSKGVTTMSSIDNANMYGAITRAEMAKMLSVYATEVLGMTPDTAAACTFSDIDSVKGDLHDFIIESCQLGIMGQGITAFRAYDTISRAEFGTALSRVLWGSQYEGGTPYYAKHLEALRSAGIMTQIANAESTKEVRGYVMLMLQRSDENGAGVDCDDPMTVIACAADSSACPAACRDNGEEEEDNKVVKAGDLEVTAEAASSRKAILNAVSDLDTLTFKTSEEVSITKVTLERYGYSNYNDVKGVWLEDEDGNVIAESKTLNSKDKVTLSIKKDYRAVDGAMDATIVVELKDSSVVDSSTIGFKVIDVESTAKNLDVDDYSPYEYEIVNYTAVTVSLDAKGTTKAYNYEEWESYEIAKFKLNASNSALLVRGFTLTNGATKKLDIDEFLKDVKVSMDWKEVKWVKATVDGDDLVISFNEVEIEAKGKATFAVEVTLTDFDEYGQVAMFWIEESSDLNAVEKKTWARISVTLPTDDFCTTTDYSGNPDYEAGTITCSTGNPYRKLFTAVWASHAFNGSKIKLSNTKLNNVDAAQGSTDVVVSEWNVTVSESVKVETYNVTAIYTKNSPIIEEMHLSIAGEEYDATPKADPVICTNSICGNTTSYYTTFTFSDVEIEKSGKFQIKVDIDSEAEQNTVVTFKWPFNSSVFTTTNAKYVDAKEPVQPTDVAGSISFATKLTVQPAKASLENSLSKAVEFVTNQTSRKVVFDGTYTAKKWDVYLQNFKVTASSFWTNNDVTYYVYIDGDEIADGDAGEEVVFSDVLVKNWESVKVKVEAEVEAYWDPISVADGSIELRGEDVDGNEAGHASDTLVEMKVREAGSVTVSAAASKNTVLLRAKNQKVAEFTVKPSNSADEDLSLDEFTLDFGGSAVKKLVNGSWQTYTLQSTDVRVKVDGVEQDDDSFTYYPNADMRNGIDVEVSLKNEYKGIVNIKVKNVNKAGASKVAKEFSKRYEDALVTLHTTDSDGSTKVYLAVEKADSDMVVSNVVITTDELLSAATSDVCWSAQAYSSAPSDWSASLYFTDSSCTTAGPTAFASGTYYKKTPGTSATYRTIVLTSDEVSDGDDFEVAAAPDKSTHFITAISYEVDGDPVEILKSDFNDYFKDGSSYAKIFKVD